MKKYLSKTYFPGMLGRGIEYYDLALYAYMAPTYTDLFSFLDTTPHFACFLFEFIAVIFQFLRAKLFGSLVINMGRKSLISEFIHEKYFDN